MRRVKGKETSSYRCVYYCGTSQKWRFTSVSRGKRYTSPRYKTEVEALLARINYDLRTA